MPESNKHQLGTHCPWCSQALTHEGLAQDIRNQVADELDAWIRGARETGGQEGVWWARGLSFASMWLRGASNE